MPAELRDVRGLVPNALEVGDQLERGGDKPQISRHRLLPQQKPQAELLNITLHAVDPVIGLKGGMAQAVVVGKQALAGRGNRLLAQRAHALELPAQGLKLFVVSRPHYPNLPVM